MKAKGDTQAGINSKAAISAFARGSMTESAKVIEPSSAIATTKPTMTIIAKDSTIQSLVTPLDSLGKNGISPRVMRSSLLLCAMLGQSS